MSSEHFGRKYEMIKIAAEPINWKADLEFGNGEANSFRGEEENEVTLNQRNSPIICTGTSRKNAGKINKTRRKWSEIRFGQKTKNAAFTHCSIEANCKVRSQFFIRRASHLLIFIFFSRNYNFAFLRQFVMFTRLTTCRNVWNSWRAEKESEIAGKRSIDLSWNWWTLQNAISLDIAW